MEREFENFSFFYCLTWT